MKIRPTLDSFSIMLFCCIVCEAFISDPAGSTDNLEQQVMTSSKKDRPMTSDDPAVTSEANLQPISCYTCSSQDVGVSCMNGTLTQQQPQLQQQCQPEQRFCLVRVYKSAISVNASTVRTRVWSLERQCAERCEENCLIVGERTKIISCVSCCSDELCNHGNGASAMVFSHIMLVLLLALQAFVVPAFNRYLSFLSLR